MNKIAFFIFGPQGSGKGTQAEFIKKKYHCLYISTGDMIRDLSLEKSETGTLVHGLIRKGKLVPDEITNDLVVKSLTGDQNVIFDGYPRNIDQAMFVTELLRSHGYRTIAIMLKLDDKTCIERITHRRICSKCHSTIYPKDIKNSSCPKCSGDLVIREDDNEVNAKNRLHIYHHETDPVVDYFNKLGVMLKIDGRPSIVTVQRDIASKLGAFI